MAQPLTDTKGRPWPRPLAPATRQPLALHIPVSPWKTDSSAFLTPNMLVTTLFSFTRFNLLSPFGFSKSSTPPRKSQKQGLIQWNKTQKKMLNLEENSCKRGFEPFYKQTPHSCLEGAWQIFVGHGIKPPGRLSSSFPRHKLSDLQPSFCTVCLLQIPKVQSS